jgi:carbon storage regulator
MLVLSRKKDETIVLKSPGADDIKITVVRIDNRNKVRIGIDAPQEVTVIRSELENKNLSSDLSDDLRVD